MPQVAGKYESPFYREVYPWVQGELSARAYHYGKKTRGSGADRTAKSVMWSYGKKPWARITGGGITLGTNGSPVMSNRNGDLTMYSAQRNVPRFPLLKSLELSNEGTMGSLLKGKFTFVIYPRINAAGFELGGIETAFFTPGNEVNVSWGWSVAAANGQACRGQFKGIIYNFNWSVNPDLSITADVSIVSAATVSVGVSGDQTSPDQQGTGGSAPVIDPLGAPIVGPNLASVIDKDFASPTAWGASNGLAPGQATYIAAAATANQLLDYFAIGLPFQAVEPESESNDPNNTDSAQQKAQAPPPPIPKTFYYIKLATVTEFVNALILRLEGSAVGGPLGSLFRVQSLNNPSAHNPVIKSAFPIDVYFPDPTMGEYGPTLNPFLPNPTVLVTGMPAGQINIGYILLGTDFVKNTYKNFVEKNSANIPYKNITSFFEEICKKINEATGDAYQITATLFEPTSDVGGAPPANGQCILSIEDTNMEKSLVDAVNPYVFGVNIFRPLIKNASISCKPPAASAAAAYTSARAAKAPTNVDVNNTPRTLRSGADQPLAGVALGAGVAGTPDAKGELLSKKDSAVSSGFNKSWGEQFRGLLQKYKKFQTESGASGASQDGHWLNAAIYPIDLTLTIDGINGFKFGDTLECRAIPSRYNTPPWQIVFTVVKVNHVIDDSKWETTLTTKARINFG
jgi:hypothetical protein